MIESVKFGDVFVSKGDYYIFLALQDDLIYVGKILDDMAAGKIENLFKIRTIQGGEKEEKAKDNILFSYVILRTEAFKNKMCHFKDTTSGKNSDDTNFFEKLVGSLNKEDLIQVRDEIINGPLPIILKEIVKNIDIPK